ncbi:20633_t:CDS:1, partial [Dentiscutata erythropus]
NITSWPDTIQKGNSHIIYKPDLIFIVYLNGQIINLLNMVIGCPNSSKQKQKQDHLKLAQLAKNLIDFARIHLKQYIKREY